MSSQHKSEGKVHSPLLNTVTRENGHQQTPTCVLFSMEGVVRFATGDLKDFIEQNKKPEDKTELAAATDSASFLAFASLFAWMKAPSCLLASEASFPKLFFKNVGHTHVKLFPSLFKIFKQDCF